MLLSDIACYSYTGNDGIGQSKMAPLTCILSVFPSQISVVGDPVLNVNCLHVQSFDAELYRQLISYPQVTAPVFRSFICRHHRQYFTVSS